MTVASGNRSVTATKTWGGRPATKRIEPNQCATGSKIASIGVRICGIGVRTAWTGVKIAVTSAKTAADRRN